MSGPNGISLESRRIWTRRGESESSGTAEAGSYEIFNLEIPSGPLAIGTYAASGECSLIIWCDGAERLTTECSEAQKVNKP